MGSSLGTIEEALANHETLLKVCDSRPSVYELPYMKSETEQFVIVWPHIPERLLGYENVIRVAFDSIVTLIQRSLLEQYEAISVVPFTGKNLAGEGRIVRVSVFEPAYQRFCELHLEDFLGQRSPNYAGWYAEPTDGVQAYWYRDPLLL